MSLRHIIFEPNKNNNYKIVLLIKESSFIRKEIEEYYFKPLAKLGINPRDVLVYSLDYNEANKTPVKLIKNYLDKFLLPALRNVNATTLICADPNYFKVLTKESKSEPHYGYILDCKYPGSEGLSITLSVGYGALFYTPTLQARLDTSLQTIADFTLRIAVEPGVGIIHSVYYPSILDEIENALNDLHKHAALTVDIETYSLEFQRASIGTIAFAWNQHNGIAFGVDLVDSPIYINQRYTLLRTFFRKYRGKLIYHNGNYDIKVLIYELFMSDGSDTKGLIDGLNVMYRNVEDTKIITYLATNTTSGNHLSLKHNAAEFAGNYAKEDINDITKIPSDELLEYNLIDCLSTWYVYNKNYPIMIHDNQLRIYEEIMKPSMRVVTQMEIQGMPLDMTKVKEATSKLTSDKLTTHLQLYNTNIVKDFTKLLQLEALVKKRATLKVKQIEDDYFDSLEFNPNSNKQVARLLHEFLELPIIDTTPTGAASVGGDTLRKHINALKLKHNINEEDLK